MSKDNTISAPASSAGIMRFYDVTSSKLLLEPKVVLIASVAFILLEVVLGLVL
jgi:preprotein translocase subunit Sec61beta